jgi:hypothetical protein
MKTAWFCAAKPGSFHRGLPMVLIELPDPVLPALIASVGRARCTGLAGQAVAPFVKLDHETARVYPTPKTQT